MGVPAIIGSWFWRTAAFLAALAVPVFLVTANLRLVTQSPWLYEYGFRTYDAPSRTGLPMEQLLSAADQTRRYFLSDEKSLSVTVDRDGRSVSLYNEREVSHMADVKGLFRMAQRVEELASGFLLAFIGLGLWLLKRRFIPHLLEAAFLGGILTVALVLAAGAGALLDFNALFLQFHLVSFANDLWQLDPARDRLIQMYPAEFFRDATMAIGGLTLLEGNLLWAVAAGLRARTKAPAPAYTSASPLPEEAPPSAEGSGGAPPSPPV